MEQNVHYFIFNNSTFLFRLFIARHEYSKVFTSTIHHTDERKERR